MNTTSPRRPLLLAATTALLIGSALAAAVPAQAATAELGDVENSLVHIYTEYSGYIYYPTDDGWEWSEEVTAGTMCTGWFASDDGYIATAGHCVQPEQGRRAILQKFLAEWDAEDLLADAITSWTVEGYEEGSEIDRSVEVVQPDGADDPVIDSWTVAQVIDFQDFEDGDAALLKVAGVSGMEPLTVASTTPEVGDDIVSIGFPGTVQQVVDVSRLSASFKTGTVSSQQVTDNGVPVTEINAQVSGGMSGGPTIDGTGHVIGINSFGILGEPQSFNFVTDTDALAQFLTSHGVEFTAASAATTSDDDVTGTDGAVASDKGGTAVGSAGPGASSDSSESSPFVGLLIGGMIAVVLAGGIGAVVLIIVVSRRRSRNPGTQGLAMPVPAPAPAAPAQSGYAATPQVHAPAEQQPVYTPAEQQPVYAPAEQAYASAPQPVYAAAPAPQPTPVAPAPAGFAAPAQAAPFAAPLHPPLPPHQG